ncbi:hypothetical protein IAT38_005885 [Cryptococcus sp. DSM 104549]
MAPNLTPTSSARKTDRKRNSKACNSCQTRKIQCTGVAPCPPCLKRGLEDACVVREKARHRGVDALIAGAEGPIMMERLGSPVLPPSCGAPTLFETSLLQAGAGVVEPLAPEARQWEGGEGVARSSSGHMATPLLRIEASLERWCQTRDVPIASLKFQQETRLAPLPGTALPSPPLINAFEDALIEHLFTSSSLDHLQAADQPRFLDRPQLLRLYSRFRHVPSSLTDDQRAFVYATLCLSRFNQIKKEWEQAMEEGTAWWKQEVAREDVTYFRKASEALREWNRPSIFAMWALFCLVPYTTGMGTYSEMRALLEQTASYSKQLGLHKKATASLYAPQDQAGLLFSAFYYSDIFRASLTDLKPCITLQEIDVDPTPPLLLIPHCLARASYHTARYLRDCADDTVDTETEYYITSIESGWQPDLKDLRHGRVMNTPRCQTAWAEFRYSWLRILLYTPHLTHPRLSAQAHAVVARAITQILHIYAELVSIKQLNPSWPQIQRLVVCGQLLILCHESGELRAYEAQTLFGLVVDLLDKHAPTWPVCDGLAEGFQRAARVFGFQIERQPLAGEEGGCLPNTAEIGGVLDAGLWNGFSMDYFAFDPTLLFANMGYDAALPSA